MIFAKAIPEGRTRSTVRARFRRECWPRCWPRRSPEILALSGGRINPRRYWALVVTPEGFDAARSKAPHGI